MAYIVFENEDEKILVELEPDEEYVVGRIASCDIRFSGKERVSRKHCVIYYSEEIQAFMIEDLGSTNGTMINGRRITKPERIYNRDEIKTGLKSLFYFEDINEATDTERRVCKVAAPVKVFGLDDLPNTVNTRTDSINNR